jgi:hypothetical protein
LGIKYLEPSSVRIKTKSDELSSKDLDVENDWLPPQVFSATR